MLLFTFTVVTGPPSSKWYQENSVCPEIFVIAVVKLSRAQIGDFYLDPLRVA